MNLWEGNIGVQAGADFIHGSSSHNTLFRCRFAGWQHATITSNNNAIEFQYKNSHMNVLGCVLGTSGKSDTYESAYPASGNSELRNIWRLGYGGPSFIGDTTVRATLLRHHNYDYVTRSTINDPSIPDTILPASLYLSSKPAWWGNTLWPPIGPDVAGLTDKIPAQIRYESSLPTGVRSGQDARYGSPARYQLFQNYPNPFNPSTTFSFALPARSFVVLRVCDILGREVATLLSEEFPAGTFTKEWNTRSVPSGVYFFQMRARPVAGTVLPDAAYDDAPVGTFVGTKKLMLLR
jgi:hypothetical protein